MATTVEKDKILAATSGVYTWLTTVFVERRLQHIVINRYPAF